MNEREVAVQAVVEASKLCHAVQKTITEKQALTKKDRSPVTIADYASQAMISYSIHKAFRGDVIMAEEESKLLEENKELRKKVVELVSTRNPSLKENELLKCIEKSSPSKKKKDRFWVLDPLDGTKGFLAKQHYAIALALVEEGEVVLGVIGCPNLTPNLVPGENGFIYTAEKGKGTTKRHLNDTEEAPIHVSQQNLQHNTVLCTSRDSSHSSSEFIMRLADDLATTQPIIYMHGQGKYALVAQGQASAYFRSSPDSDYKDKIWDHAAGSIVVAEAGGTVTDLKGKPLDFSQGTTLSENSGILSSNTHMHAPLLTAVSRILEKSYA